MKTIYTKFLTAITAMTMCSCAGGPNATTGTLVGAGTGALIGGAIGRNNGNTAAGAALGAVAGGAVGNAVGNQQDQRNYHGGRYYRY